MVLKELVDQITTGKMAVYEKYRYNFRGYLEKFAKDKLVCNFELESYSYFYDREILDVEIIYGKDELESDVALLNIIVSD